MHAQKTWAFRFGIVSHNLCGKERWPIGSIGSALDMLYVRIESIVEQSVRIIRHMHSHNYP